MRHDILNINVFVFRFNYHEIQSNFFLFLYEDLPSIHLDLLRFAQKKIDSNGLDGVGGR